MEYVSSLFPNDIAKLIEKYEPSTRTHEINRKPEHITYWQKQCTISEILYGNTVNKILQKKDYEKQKIN